MAAELIFTLWHTHTGQTLDACCVCTRLIYPLKITKRVSGTRLCLVLHNFTLKPMLCLQRKSFFFLVLFSWSHGASVIAVVVTTSVMLHHLKLVLSAIIAAMKGHAMLFDERPKPAENSGFSWCGGCFFHQRCQHQFPSCREIRRMSSSHQATGGVGGMLSEPSWDM